MYSSTSMSRSESDISSRQVEGCCLFRKGQPKTERENRQLRAIILQSRFEIKQGMANSFLHFTFGLHFHQFHPHPLFVFSIAICLQHTQLSRKQRLSTEIVRLRNELLCFNKVFFSLPQFVPPKIISAAAAATATPPFLETQNPPWPPSPPPGFQGPPPCGPPLGEGGGKSRKEKQKYTGRKTNRLTDRQTRRQNHFE